MLNYVVMCGRLTQDPEIKELENDRKVATITLAVQRSYKNIDGIYDTDFIHCTLWNGIAENTTRYCKKGDIVGVKGRLQTTIIEKEDGTKENKLEVIAEKVTFLSSRKEEDRD